MSRVRGISLCIYVLLGCNVSASVEVMLPARPCKQQCYTMADLVRWSVDSVSFDLAFVFQCTAFLCCGSSAFHYLRQCDPISVSALSLISIFLEGPSSTAAVRELVCCTKRYPAIRA